MTRGSPRCWRGDGYGPTLWDAVRAILSPRTGLKPAESLVLLALWRHANFDGEAWPSLSTLAGEAKVSRRRAVVAVNRLRRAGAVAVVRGGGRGRANVYVVSGAWVEGVLALNESHTATGETATTHGIEVNGASPAPFEAGNGHGVTAVCGNGADSVANGAGPVRNGAEFVRNGARFAPEVLKERALEALQEEGAPGEKELSIRSTTDNGNGNDSGQEETPTVEKVVAAIAASTARLGGQHARRGRAIAAAFAEEPLATQANRALGELARDAGVARTAVGPDLMALFEAANEAARRKPEAARAAAGS